MFTIEVQSVTDSLVKWSIAVNSVPQMGDVVLFCNDYYKVERIIHTYIDGGKPLKITLQVRRMRDARDW